MFVNLTGNQSYQLNRLSISLVVNRISTLLGLPNTQVPPFCRHDSTEWQAVLQELTMSKVIDEE